MANRTHYEVLGVKPDASTEDIRRSYHALARDHHPDRVREEAAKKRAEEMFTAMTEAFNVLSDAEKRKAYDDVLRNQSSGETPAQAEARKYFRGGQVKLGDSSFKDAVRLFKAAVHLDNGPAAYYAHLAKALEGDNAMGDAARAWDEAIKRDPYNAKYYRMAGQCLEKAGMGIRARKMFESAVKWDKGDAASAEALRRLSGEDKKPSLLSGLFKRS